MSIKKYSRQEILDFLRSVSIMSTATSLNDKPFSSVLLFAVDDDFTFYFATHEDSYKSKALLKNPRISLSVWEHQKLSVQADGRATRIEDAAEVDKTLDKIVNATENIEAFWPPVLRIKKESSYVVFKVKLDWLRALDLIEEKVTDKEHPFTEIKF